MSRQIFEIVWLFERETGLYGAHDALYCVIWDGYF
jgi:hypothetical protein